MPLRTGRGDRGETWNPPFRDATDVIVEHILDRRTVEPLGGFTDEELLAQLTEQTRIMDEHEDFEALRSKAGPILKDAIYGKRKKSKKKTNGDTGISKLLTRETIRSPRASAVMQSVVFIPIDVLLNTTIVEYDGNGKVSVVST